MIIFLEKVRLNHWEKKSGTVLESLKSIFTEMTIKLHIIQSDNGAEFKNYDTIARYKEKIYNIYLHCLMPLRVMV